MQSAGCCRPAELMHTTHRHSMLQAQRQNDCRTIPHSTPRPGLRPQAGSPCACLMIVRMSASVCSHACGCERYRSFMSAAPAGRSARNQGCDRMPLMLMRALISGCSICCSSARHSRGRLGDSRSKSFSCILCQMWHPPCKAGYGVGKAARLEFRAGSINQTRTDRAAAVSVAAAAAASASQLTWKGYLPTSIVYSTTPQLQTSAALPRSLLSWAGDGKGTDTGSGRTWVLRCVYGCIGNAC